MLDNKFSTYADFFFYIDLLAKKGRKIFFLKVIFKIACVKKFHKN